MRLWLVRLRWLADDFVTVEEYAEATTAPEAAALVIAHEDHARFRLGIQHVVGVNLIADRVVRA